MNTLLARVRDSAARERPLGPRGLAIAAAVVVAASVVAAAMPGGAAARWALAAVLAVVLGFVCWRSTTEGVLVTFTWLVLLGLARRLASEVIADPGRDPLIMVGVAAAAVLLVRALLAGALRRLTLLSWLMLAFTALAFLELLNPDQTNGFGRFAGLLVWVAPTLWFWVGRQLVGRRLAHLVLLLTLGLTTLVGFYGIVQSLVGFPPWDQRWINLRGYAALYIGFGTVRPFGTYASAAEFGVACAVGAVLAIVVVFAPRLAMAWTAHAGTRADGPTTTPGDEPGGPRRDLRRADRRERRDRTRWVIVGLVALAITSLALLLSAIRTYLVLLVVAVPVMYLVYRGRRAWKVLVPAGVVVVIVFAAVSQIDPNSLSDKGPEAALRRAVVFVNDPFASQSKNYENTLDVHLSSAKFGIEQAFRHPLGRGTGSTKVTGESFGEKSHSTDFDISDAGIAFGILGVIICALIVVIGIGTAVRVARWQPTFERVALVGILIVSIGVWFQGGHYAFAPLLWLLLGRADAAIARGRHRAHLDLDLDDPPADPPVDPANGAPAAVGAPG
ncbi:MAG: hypothetical protein U0W40_00605 [Acidimicrobiia bacterium]